MAWLYSYLMTSFSGTRYDWYLDFTRAVRTHPSYQTVCIENYSRLMIFFKVNIKGLVFTLVWLLTGSSVPISTFMCLWTNYISTMGLSFLLEEICRWTDPPVEIAAEAALFPEKEYIFGIAVAVRDGVPDGIRTWNCLTACRRANHSDMPHPT